MKKQQTIHKEQYKYKKGFTLIETLVAITVLLLAVAAPLTLGSKGLTASRVARDQVIAVYLTQEVIEYVRNVRDTNSLNGSNWLAGLSECIAPSVCIIDVPEGAVIVCPAGVCETVDFQTANGMYGYSKVGGVPSAGWEVTRFRRSVTIATVPPGDDRKLSVTVSWMDGLLPRTIVTDEYIFPWP